MLTINPYLNFDGTCAEAFRFYAEVLDGTITFMQTMGESPMADMAGPEGRDRIMHVTLEVGGQAIMGSDSMSGRHEKPQGLWVSLQMDDVARAERIFNAFADGGNAVMPLQKTFWAERFGMVVDRYGTPWMVNCGETPPAS